MKEHDICPHCKEKKLVVVPEVFPYGYKHLICIGCDSTYNIED